LIGITDCAVWLTGFPAASPLEAGRSGLIALTGVGVAGLPSATLSIFWVSVVCICGSGVGCGFKVGLRELYGSLSANNVGFLTGTGVTSLRSTASAARGRSLGGRSRTRRVRGSPWTLQGSLGVCVAVASSMYVVRR